MLFNYGYYKNGDHATSLVNSILYKKNGIVTDREFYTYDNMGNITTISKNGIKQKEYKYDTLGRLIYENNLDTNREISYTYDRQGNILSKTENGTKIDYAYDQNGFKLLSFGDQAYSYDNLGNPLNLNSTYYGASWTKARLLTKLNASSHNLNFSYDGNGSLKGFSVGGTSVNYTYVYEDGKLIRQTYNNTTHTDFLYGKEGLLGFTYNGETYLYQKNVFGDIVKILNSTGQVVAEYSYTAFGECTIVTNVNGIAGVNPFRYRGYFLESNSGLYYLKTRFYNPVTGRFISPDDTKYLQPDIINGLNLYAYCNNNPIMKVDPNGNFAIWALVLLIAAVVAFTPVGGAITQAVMSVGGYIGMAIGSLFDEDIRSDMDAINWNPFNSSKQKVLDSKKVSFYKGIPVYRTNLDRSGSFAGIFLRREVAPGVPETDKNQVLHEYGHIFQQLLLGPGGNALYVMLPSWREWGKAEHYYDSIVEILANAWGGIPEGEKYTYSNGLETDYSYTTSEKQKAKEYLLLSMFFGPLAYLMFL